MTYSVRSIKVGQVDVPGPELYWMGGWHEWFTLAFQVVLIQGDGVCALVNTGPPADLAPINDLWTADLGARGALLRQPHEQIEAALAAAGVRPADVTHVIITPLQLYSTSNIPLFDHAQVCLSRRGWVHFHTTHDHPHDIRWNSISRDVLVHLVTDAWDRVCLLDDEDEIAPGLRTWWCGAHHRASMVIEVDTTVGVVAISDSFFYFDNVEDNRPLGISENLYETAATYERVRRTAARLVPLYDPKVFERYPGGVVTGTP